MIVNSLKIKHFRCLHDFEIEFEPLTAMLGRNGAGKSSVLYALEVFYDISASISEEDFYNRDIRSPIEITLTFGQLRDDELVEFEPYISDANLTVTKRIAAEDGHFSQLYYASLPQYRRFVEIRALEGAIPKREAWNEFVDSQEFPGLQSATTVAQVEQHMAAFEAQHQDLLEPIEKEEQFFGPPNIGGGKLDNYTKFLLIPAVKDVSDELSERRGSSLYQLLDVIVLRKIESREDIAHRRNEIEDQIKELFDPSNLPELSDLGADISTLLKRFFPGTELVLDWADVHVPELKPPMANPKLIEDEFEGDIDKKGHGLQRALLITLLQYLVQIPLSELTAVPEESDRESHAASNSAPEIISPSLILAIEEPELYLHPLRCKYLAGLFSELTCMEDEQSVVRNQIIYSSHSPHFVDLQSFETIRILRKTKPSDFPAAVSNASSFPIAIALQKLTETANLNPDDVTEQSFKAHIAPVMSSIVNEGFFADLVVLVEGFGDAGIFTKLQDLMEKDWITLGVAIIPIEGKTKLDRPALIFQGLGIPVYLIFDGDKNNQGTDQEAGTTRMNRLLLRLLDSPEEDFPKTQINSKWAVFERDIEDELKRELGEESYVSLRQRVGDDFGFAPSQVTKSLHCSARFIELIYEEGNRVSVLEEVIEAISALAS